VIDRLRSLKARIFLALGAILGLVACVVMAYSLFAVRTAGVAAEQRSVENVLRMAELAIRGEYRTLLTGKVGLVQERKARLREFDRVVLDTLARFRALAERGVISEPQAQEMALEWLKGVRPAGGDYLLAFDRDGRALVYPDQSLIGTRLGDFVDFKGRSVVEAAWSETERYGDTFLIYNWKSLQSDTLEPRYGHFVAYEPWQWMIASVGNIDAVQAEADARLRQFRAELARTLGEVQMVGDGFVFVFDGQGEMVVPPPASQQGIDDDVLTRLRVAARDRSVTSFAAPAGRSLHGWATYVRSLDWYVAAVASDAAINAPATALVTRQALVFGGGLAIGLVLAWVVASGIARPLVRLGSRAHSLSATDFTQARSTDAISDLPLARADEIGALARAFAFMETELYRNVRSLMEVTGERERIEGELGVARDIQLGLLPKVFPAFPERDDIDLHAALVSAREVGGDLYDFHLDGDEISFTIGDVAGKGVPAALFMAITKTLMQTAGENNDGPGEAVREVNEHLARDNPNAMFVTAVHGVLDCRDGAVRYANGGHNPPVVMRRDGACEIMRGVSGPALGALDGVDYCSFETRLAPGDLLFLYTDGVTEAMNEAGELYGETRMLAVLGACPMGASAEAVIAAIMDDLERHVGAAAQSDDITILALRYLGPQARVKSAEHEEVES
jgi:sigma-B regulation protein RsbU (phosphoserine phosphatase)